MWCISTGSLLRSQLGGGIREFMFTKYFENYGLIVLRAGYYDDVEVEWGTRLRSHYGQGASVYHVSLSHAFTDASRYQSIWSLVGKRRFKNLGWSTGSTPWT